MAGTVERVHRPAVQRRQPVGDDLVGVPAVLAARANEQCGILTRRQILDAGISARQLRAEHRARRWRVLGSNVIVLHNADLSAAQRTWAAVLFLDKPCALAGLSAAAAAGLRGFEPDRIHVVVAHDTHVRVPVWVKLHESRRFRPTDIHLSSGPPRTSTARSVIDAAAWSAWPRRACAILCAAVQQRLVTPTTLSRELSRAGQVRHAAVMRDVLGDISGGGHTLAEIDLAPLARRAGLGPPRRQQTRLEPSGRRRYLDAEFDLPDGTVLVVEVDGAGHLDPDTWTDDLDRENEVVIGLSPVLRFASVTIRIAPQRVVDQLTRMRLAHSRNDLSARRAG